MNSLQIDGQPVIYQNTADGLEPTFDRASVEKLSRVTRAALLQPHLEQGSADWLFARRFWSNSIQLCRGRAR